MAPHRPPLETDMTKAPLPDPQNHIILHFVHPNDEHGNPRRVYVVLDTSGPYPRHVGTYDEGYAGLDACAALWGDEYYPPTRAAWGARVCSPTITCSLRDYRAYVRLGEAIRAEALQKAQREAQGDTGLHVGQGPL